VGDDCRSARHAQRWRRLIQQYLDQSGSTVDGHALRLRIHAGVREGKNTSGF
jgi:hypothetical protein